MKQVLHIYAGIRKSEVCMELGISLGDVVVAESLAISCWMSMLLFHPMGKNEDVCVVEQFLTTGRNFSPPLVGDC